MFGSCNSHVHPSVVIEEPESVAATSHRRDNNYVLLSALVSIDRVHFDATICCRVAWPQTQSFLCLVQLLFYKTHLRLVRGYYADPILEKLQCFSATARATTATFGNGCK